MEFQVKSISLIVGFLFMASTSVAQNEHIESQRQLLKEYFLYASLKNAYGKECLESDFSASYYMDVASYGVEAFHQLDSLANVFVQTIFDGTDEKKYPTIYLDCMEKYRSEELHKFILELDRYRFE